MCATGVVVVECRDGCEHVGLELSMSNAQDVPSLNLSILFILGYILLFCFVSNATRFSNITVSFISETDDLLYKIPKNYK